MTSKKKKTITIILSVIAILIAAGAFYGYKEYNRKQKDISDLSAHFTLNSNVLITDFTKDEKASNLKYLDKVIAVDGILKAIDKDDKGNFTLVIGDTASTSSVRCSMDSIHNTEATNVKEGSFINVKGVCTGYTADELGLGSDVILNRSCIIKKQ
ncbi:MAG: hypothetical protein IPP48_09710 [Chitinophagaceae bacterium]|nr:hypothetical protein [Chitinophagaceae bacterium]